MKCAKPRLQSRNFRLSAPLVQQAAILFKALPRCVRATKAATKAGCVDLLRMVFLQPIENPRLKLKPAVIRTRAY